MNLPKQIENELVELIKQNVYVFS